MNDNLLQDEERPTELLGEIRETTIQKIEELGDEEKKSEMKNSSIQTIFSIWNTMIGSTTVSVPFNVYYAGIIPAIFLGLLYGFVCYFTCSVIVRLGEKQNDFAVIVYNYLLYGFGKKAANVGKIIQIIFNLMINIGATFVYFLIINQNLYPCVCLFLRLFGVELDADDIEPRFDRFSTLYLSLIVCCITFPLTIQKKSGCLTKFNSYGIYFVSVLLIYVIYVGIHTMCTNTFKFEYKENIKGNEERNLFLFGVNPGKITGTLSLGLFVHSVILPILKNNKRQENNQRDLFVGYTLVTFTYIIIGIFGYIGFSGSEFSTEFKDNWFRFYGDDNYIVLVIRILNVVQLITIFPILFFAVRSQLFENFFKSYHQSPSKYPRIIFSIILLILCIIILYLFYNSLSDLIRYIGAISALVLIYTIAPLINMINYYIKHQPKEEIEKLEKSTEKLIIPININELVPLRPWKAFIFYISMMLIIVLGIITLIVQMMEINFFGIKIEKNS